MKEEFLKLWKEFEKYIEESNEEKGYKYGIAESTFKNFIYWLKGEYWEIERNL